MISVLICTYKRPVLLKGCIESVLRQKTTAKYEIVVIDNDEIQSAKPIVDKFDNKVLYFCQTKKGLSHARNLAVSKAKGEFILFIDDDEYADENWISNIVACQIKFNADVVLGRVIYQFPSKFPSYIKKSSYFTRKNKTTGQKAFENEGYTGNTLVKSELFTLRTPSFLNVFNHTGGEDSEFFNFLLSRNANIVFSNEAIIYEIQDDQRLKTSWFFRRGFRSGYNFTNQLFNNNKILIAVLKLLYSTIGGLILSFILAFQAIFNPNLYFIKLVTKLGNQCGKIGNLLRIQLKDYN